MSKSFITMSRGTDGADCSDRTRCYCGAPVTVTPCTWKGGEPVEWRMTYAPDLAAAELIVAAEDIVKACPSSRERLQGGRFVFVVDFNLIERLRDAVTPASGM